MSPLANIKWREQVEISCGINKYPPQHHIGGKTNKQFSWKNGNSPVIQTPQHMHFLGVTLNLEATRESIIAVDPTTHVGASRAAA